MGSILKEAGFSDLDELEKKEKEEYISWRIEMELERERNW